MKNDLPLNAVLMGLLTLICVTLVLVGLNSALKANGRDALLRRGVMVKSFSILAAWMLLLAVLSGSGFFAVFNQLPPRPALAILLPLPFVLFFALSKRGTQFLQAVPGHWLIYMQSFRIFVEILLWLAFLEGQLPVQMTFEGLNFDVLSGILALPAAYLLSKRKRYSSTAALIYNSIGLLLLLNILVIAILSMPTSLRYFMNEPSNLLVARFPFIWLPGVLVPLAYTLHIFSIRQLVTRNQQQKIARQLAV